MLAAIYGISAALVQLFIIYKLSKAVTSGKGYMTGIFIMIKIAVWALFFTLMVLFFREKMLICAISIAATLVLGGLLLFLISSIKQNKKEKKRES